MPRPAGAHPGHSRVQACRHGQQDRRLHQPPLPAESRPMPSPAPMTCVS